MLKYRIECIHVRLQHIAICDKHLLSSFLIQSQFDVNDPVMMMMMMMNDDVKTENYWNLYTDVNLRTKRYRRSNLKPGLAK